MIPLTKTFEQGFTAVELLITLIIASMFLFSGYQLYSQVIRDGADANKLAVVSSKVLERVRKVAANPALSCTTTVPNETVTESGIGSVVYVTTISCPNSSLPTMKLIRVDATYDVNKKVQHAIYSS